MQDIKGYEYSYLQQSYFPLLRSNEADHARLAVILEAIYYQYKGGGAVTLFDAFLALAPYVCLIHDTRIQQP